MNQQQAHAHFRPSGINAEMAHELERLREAYDVLAGLANERGERLRALEDANAELKEKVAARDAALNALLAAGRTA